MTEQTEKTETAEKTETTALPPKKRRVCRILLWISAVIFLPILALLIALSTSAGQRGILQLADHYLDNLHIGSLSGGLQEGLVLNQLQVTSEGVNTEIEQVRLQMGLSCLLRLEICIQDIRISQPKVTVDTALLPPAKEKPKNQQPMKRIHLPVSVVIDNILVEQTKVRIDDTQIDLDRFQTALSLNNDTGLTLQPTSIDALQIAMKAKAQAETLLTQTPTNTPATETQTATEKVKEKVAEKMVETVNEQVEQALSEHTATTTPPQDSKKNAPPVDWDALAQRLSQPLLGDFAQIELPFDIHIPNIQGQEWQYQQLAENPDNHQRIHVSHVQLQAEAIGDKVELKTFKLESSVGQIQGHGQLQLSGDYPLQFQLKTQLAEQTLGENVSLPASHAQLDLHGNLLKQTALSLQMEGAIKATLTGQFALHQAKTPFQLQFNVKDFVYPWEGAQQNPLQVPMLDLTVGGDLLHYHINLATSAQGMDIPKTQLNLNAIGELTHVEIQQLVLDTLQGQAAMQGKVGWRHGVQWYSDVQLTKLNLSQYVANTPTLLSGHVLSTGLIDQSQWLIDVPNLDLQGRLSNKPLSLKGTLSVGSEHGIQDLLVKLPQLLLNYGENTVNVQGVVGEKSDVNLAIQAPNLQGLLPTLAGSVQGNMQLTGNIAQPTLVLDLVGKQIKFDQLNLAHIQAKGEVDIAQQSKGRLGLQLEGLHYSDIKLNSVNLSLQGDEKQHQLILNAQGSPVSAKWNVQGHFDRGLQRWNGNLSQVLITSPVGNWQTNQPVDVVYEHQKAQANIHAHCWLNPSIELCFPQAFNVGAAGEVPFQLKKLDLALVNELVEQKLLKGQLASEGKVAWFKDKAPELQLTLNGKNIEFSQKVDRKQFNLDILNVGLKANLLNNHLALTSNIDLQDQAKITTQLDIKDLAKTRQLSGALVIQNLNLDIFNQLLSLKENIVGNVAANIKFGGSVTAPDLTGSFNIQSIRAAIKALPFDIHDGQLNLSFRGHRSTLQGYLQTDESRLDLTGEASWQNIEKWTSALHVKAEQFKVEIPAMARLKVSPDIHIKADPKRLALSGKIDIPWARIAIEALPESAVSVSPDEVILDGKTKAKKLPNLPAKTKSGMEIVSHLNINIGKDVHLDAYGLTSHLNGLLSVRQERGNLGLYGQIHLTNGRYASFGQDLLIRKGLISFSGLPSQPMLNIEAIRNPEAMETSGIIAGVKVVGLAQSPEVKVFSEPSMPQDQALSYILTGRSLENSGEGGSGGSIGAALLGLGLAKSGKVVGGIGQAFGIQDLNLGTQGVGDGSKVVVSGSITPRLQVKYGVGLFDGLAEFTVRYRLLPKLYLQSVSGVTQAVDLLYQFEF
ncbi:translocation/assembly module TamB domain-containing protein [Pasteurella sp. PK-2025]|uniref:autotransporter assembly complex protein TamB n=1 Tax=Pasteurella sp. PK-2025 TaxID=3413133 RepID=UPI003C718AB8